MKYFTFFVFFLLSFLIGCPKPGPSVLPDAMVDASVVDAAVDSGDDADAMDDASLASAQKACMRMEALGCPEGLADNCVKVLNHVLVTKLTTVNVACLAKATSVDAVRKCGQPCRIN